MSWRHFWFFLSLFSIFHSLCMFLLLQLFKHESMLIFDILTQIKRIKPLLIQRNLIFNTPVLFLESSSNSIIDFPVSNISMIRKCSMKVVSMRCSFFDKNKGNIGDSAIINKILERIWPKENTNSSQNLKDKSNS